MLSAQISSPQRVRSHKAPAAARLHGCTAARLYHVDVRRRAAARYRDVKHGHMRRRKTAQMLDEDDIRVFIRHVYMFGGVLTDLDSMFTAAAG